MTIIAETSRESMLVPEMLIGESGAVTAACSRHITQFKRGASWEDAGTMIEVRGVSGLIMVGNPSPLLTHGNIRLCTPFQELDKAVRVGKITLEDSIRAFDEALSHPWSVLGLLSPVCYRWLRDRERAGRFLKAMIAYWEAIDAVGARYTCALQHGQRLWELPVLLKVVLGDRGVSKAQLMEPLPAGGIAALLPSKN